MKSFLFILLIFSVTSSFVYENIPLGTYLAKIRKELKQISSLHSIEELTYGDFDYELDKVIYTLSSVKSKAIFFNPYMLIGSVTNPASLTFEFKWTAPKGCNLSPYHSIYTADLMSNNKTYQIEFVVEAKSFRFVKNWKLYDTDKIYVPSGEIQIQFVSLKAKNLDKNSPYTEELILKIVNGFLDRNDNKRNKAISDATVGYYKSLPFDEYGQRISIHTSTYPKEVNFDLNIEEMPSYENETDICVFKRKGTLKNNSTRKMEYNDENAETHQTFNLHGSIYQKLISDNLYGFEMEQTNNPATMYKLIGKDLKKVVKVNDSVSDDTELKIEAEMVSVSFDVANPMLGELNLLVDVISKEDQSSVFTFTSGIKFTFNPTLMQSGLNFVLLGKNVEVSEIKCPGYDIIDINTLIKWVQNTLLCALGKNEYNLFEYSLDLSYYFNTNDLSFEYVDDYLSIKKN